MKEAATAPVGSHATARPRLTLFVAGRSGRALHARTRVSELELVECGAADLRVVDVVADPAVAEQFAIIATPTLVVESVAGSQRLVGDLGDGEWLRHVLAHLDDRDPPAQNGGHP